MKTLLALLPLLALLVAAPVAAQTVVDRSSMASGLPEAFEQAAREATAGTDWVGYAIPVDGTSRLFASGWLVDGPTMAELVHLPDDRHVSIVMRMAPEGRIDRVRVLSSDSGLNDRQARLIWVGIRDQGASFSWLRDRLERRVNGDHREGLVRAIASHTRIQEALVVLAATLKSDPDPEVRGAAAHGVGRFSGDEPLRLLTEAIAQQPSLDVRQAAVFALSDRTDAAARRVIWSAAENTGYPLELRKSAVHAYEEAPDAPERYEVLALSGEPEDLRKTAIWALGDLDVSGERLRRIFAGSSAEEVRKAALFAQADRDSPETRAFLLGVALSADEELARTATYALADVLVDADTAPLERVVGEGVTLDVRRAALYALADVGGERAIAALAAIARGNHPAELRKAAIYALGDDGSPEARRVIEELARSNR